MNVETPALIFGTSITALGVVRAFGRRGIPLRAYTPDGDTTRRSRWYRPMEGTDGIERGAEPTAELLRRILEKQQFDRAVIVPCTDRWVEAAVQCQDSFGGRFAAPIAPAAAIATLLDKGSLAAALARLELPHPKTAVLQRASDVESLHSWEFEDAFLKPRSSHNFMSKLRVKGMRVSGRAEAAAKAKQLFEQGLDVLVQEYVPGPPQHHYFIDGYADRESKIRAAFARKRLRMYPPDFGNSTYMVSVSLDETGGAMSTLQTLFRELRYRGIFSAEFKKDARDGAFRLIEVNVRPWWYVDFAETSGVPITDLAYRDALGLPLADAFQYKPGRRSVYPYFDLAVWRAGRGAGDAAPGFLSFAYVWLTSNQPVFAWDDPMPAISNTWQMCTRYIRSRVRGT